MKRLSHRIASSSGICPQDSESTPRKLRAPSIPEVCPFKDPFCDKDDELQQRVGACQSAHVEHPLHDRQLMHQTAVVEIHAINNSIDEGDGGENTAL